MAESCNCACHTGTGGLVHPVGQACSCASRGGGYLDFSYAIKWRELLDAKDEEIRDLRKQLQRHRLAAMMRERAS